MENQEPKKQPRRQRDAGMTLIEIMIVLALISLVAGSIGVMVFSRYKDGQKRVAKTQVSEVIGAVQQYMMDNNNNCPQGIEELISQKLLKKEHKDPWGKPFALKCPGEQDPDGVDVTSSGPDKAEGTEDDINSWEL
jgi:general secretion pathway protein G